jgi:type I restriction enzyme S subunit
METAIENKVGYKKTKLGWIPEEWEISEFGNLCSYTKGYAFKSNTFTDKGTRIIRVSDTTENSIRDKNAIYIEEENESEFDKWRLKKDDLIFTTVGSRPPLYDSMVGKVIKVDFKNDGALLNQNAVFIRGKRNLVDQDFLFYQFKQKRYINFIETIARGNANQVSITLEDLFSFCFSLPPHPEQLKIATILSTWDKAIDILNKLISEKEQLKKGLMQQLLTGKKRFAGFTDEWKEVKLGDLIKIGSSKRVLQEEWKNDGVPFIRTREVINLSNGVDFKTPIFITEELYSELKRKYGVPKQGDLLVTGVGTIGETYIVQADDRFYFKDGNVLWFKMNTKIDSMFLHQQFKTRYIKKQLSDNASITTVSTFTIDGANGTKILLPSVEEQQKIASVLSAADKEIALLKQELSNLTNQKKGLMQKLLTGEVRVKN